MNTPVINATTSGLAFRVSILGGQHEAYEGVYAKLDPEHGVVHVLSRDAQIHYLSIPINLALIEWQDPAPLEPQPRIAPFGAAAFDRMSEHAQRMAEGMSRAFGPE
jgi:hypothetical protein